MPFFFDAAILSRMRSPANPPLELVAGRRQQRPLPVAGSIELE
jgi:hypothetical protein